MTVVAAVTLLSLGGLGYAMRGTVLYPPALFALLWGGMLMMIELTGSMFYSLSSQTLLIFVVGGLAFAAAGLATDVVAGPVPGRRAASAQTISETGNRLLWVLLAFLTLPLPLYWERLRAFVGPTGVAQFLYNVRVAALQEGPSDNALGVIANLVPASIVFALIAYSLPDGDRTRRTLRIAILLLSLAYQVSTGGRSGALTLVLSVVAVVWLRTGRLNWRAVAASVAGFALVFGVMAVLLGKGSTRVDASASENISAVAENFALYAFGGLVAFERVVDDPLSVPSTGGAARTIKEMANRFGAAYEVPSLHAQYTTVGTGYETNVYTAYFYYYPDYGLLGTLALMGFVGMITTLVFRRALTGDWSWQVLYAVLFAAILQTIFNEPFYTNLNFLIKAGLILIGMRLLMNSFDRSRFGGSLRPAHR